MSKSASVKCGECGKANTAGYKFCKGCGAPPTGAAPSASKPKCAECGKENAAGYKFCKGCGAPPADGGAGGGGTTAGKKAAGSAGGVKCGECGKDNVAGYKFCKGCGAPPGGASESKSTEIACGECGKRNVAGYKFCKGCGAPPAEEKLAKTETKPKKTKKVEEAAEEQEDEKEAEAEKPVKAKKSTDKIKKKGTDDDEAAEPKPKKDSQVKPGYGSVAVRGGGVPELDADPAPPSGKKVVCSGCGKSNPEESAACSACGDPISKKKLGTGAKKTESKEVVKKSVSPKKETAEAPPAKKAEDKPSKKKTPDEEPPKKAEDKPLKKKTPDEEPKKGDEKPSKKAVASEPAAADEPKKPEPKKKAAVSNTCHECEENLANPEQRYCLSCGARQPHAEPFKTVVKRDTIDDDQAADVENLLEEVQAKLADSKKSPRGGGDAKLKKELEAALADATKWKNLFNSAAQDVDEKDDVIASQMEKIEELESKVAELEGK